MGWQSFGENCPDFVGFIIKIQVRLEKENTKVIILTGGRDFGRSPLASRLSTALWPIMGRPAIECLLEKLKQQGIKKATVCCNGDVSALKDSIANNPGVEIKYLDEPLPVGTAGCIREGFDNLSKLLIVLHATVTILPDINALVKDHIEAGADLTVAIEPGAGNGNSENEACGVYICSRSVLEHIPADGYFDIKEGLIPALLKVGKNIYAARLKHPAGTFRNRAEYLNAVANLLEIEDFSKMGLSRKKMNGSNNIWLADDVYVDNQAQIYGPVAILEGATIAKDAIIFGPGIIGRKAGIGEGTLIDSSVVWDGAKIGRHCQIQNCLIDSNAAVSNGSIIQQSEVPYKKQTKCNAMINSVVERNSNKKQQAEKRICEESGKSAKLPKWFDSRKFTQNILFWIGGVVLLLVFMWSYWPEIMDLWNMWQRSDEYSSGLLVPFLAVYILWSRRDKFAECHIKPSVWGLFAFLAAQAFRMFGVFFMYGSAERLSIVMSIGALVLFLFGWRIFWKTFTVMIFLGLMIPLPRSIHYAVMIPLQSWATSSAVFLLEMLGYSVIREGNIIHLGETTVAVAEACNGLRMIMAFFVISGLVVLLIKEPWWEKLVILISSLPIGLFCNSVRLTITAIAFTMLDGEYWEKIFHDYGGYAMMPLALAMIVGELWLMAKLTTEPVEKQIVYANS